MSFSVPKCPKLYLCPLNGLKVSLNVLNHIPDGVKVSLSVLKCTYLSKYILAGVKVSLNVLKCPLVSLSVPIYINIYPMV